MTTKTTKCCDCRIGYYLCPVAVALWERAKECERRAWLSGDWRLYEAARDAYDEHVGKIA